jgi:hypothetical protein
MHYGLGTGATFIYARPARTAHRASGNETGTVEMAARVAANKTVDAEVVTGETGIGGTTVIDETDISAITRGT